MSVIEKPAAASERKPAGDYGRKFFPLEVKEITADGRFEGWASVFGNTDRQDDIMQRGAFTKTLQENGANGWPLLWQHWTDELIGLIESAEEKDYGLWVVGQLNLDVQRAKEAHSLLKQKAIRAMSVGYQSVKVLWDEETYIRTLVEVKLWEISLATIPANELALVSDVKTIERALRASGADPKRAAELLDELKALLLQPAGEATARGAAAGDGKSSPTPEAPASEATFEDVLKAANERASLLVRAGI